MEVPDFEHLRPEGPAYGYALAAHPAGHDHEHPVAFYGGDHREGVARVAGGRFYYSVALFEESFILGAFDHVLGDARLHGTGGIQVLQLAVDAFEFQKRSIPDGVEDVVR